MADRYLALVTAEPIDRAAAEAFVSTPADGALVVFEGVVRDHDHGASVHALDYEAHPDAQRFLARRCAPRSRMPRACESRRSTASARCRSAMSRWSPRSPHRTAPRRSRCARGSSTWSRSGRPIWKRQHLAEGTTEWVGL